MSGGTPLSLRVEVRNLDALFARVPEPTFPHTRRMVERQFAGYVENLVREHRAPASIDLEIVLREPSPGPVQEEAARRDLRTFFREERDVGELDVRVNQREGWGFLRRTFPLLIVALALAGVFYLSGPGFPSGPVGELLTALFYLLFITIVWVLLWDPIEKLLFDAYLLRSHVRALEKLGDASVRFTPAPPP